MDTFDELTAEKLANAIYLRLAEVYWPTEELTDVAKKETIKYYKTIVEGVFRFLQDGNYSEDSKT